MRLRSATLTMAGGRIGAAIFSALFFAMAARAMTTAEFSDFALVGAVGSALFFLGDAGYSILLGNHVAAVGSVQGHAVAAAVGRRLLGSCLALFVLVPAYMIAANDASPLVPLLYWLSLVGNAVHGTISAALRSVGRVVPEASNEILSRLAVVVVGAIVFALGGGLVAAVAILGAAELLSAAALTPLLLRQVRRQPGPANPRVDLRLRRAAPIAAGGGLSTLYARADTWLVAMRGPADGAGVYGAAYRVMEAIVLPSSSLGAMALVGGSRRDADVRAVVRKFTSAAVGLTAIPAAILFVIAPQALRIVFGAEYVGAAGTLRVLLVSAIGGAVVTTLAPLAAVRTARAFPACVGAALAVNVVLCVALIRPLGTPGAAWANVVTQSGLALVFLALLERSYGRSNTNIPTP